MTHDAPHDRFDEIPADTPRVGAHRAPGSGSSGWRRAGLILLAGVVLGAVGIGGLLLYNNRFLVVDPGVSASSTTAPEVKIDPSLPVTVLNGTTIDGLGAQVAETLKAQHLQVTVAAAANTATQHTVVFYASPSSEASARGVASLLGNVPIKLDPSIEARGMPLVVLLGGDYRATPSASATP
ncbi:MAG TPA: LytR C-terminal domain-containing protein [Candidatus Lumbricidophila sp.]|nr:LytR C-terminal domain-containing protein [Candidatus Lumbricidophila sp.]